VDEAVSLIVRQPACARFISRELAQYFVADDPPAPHRSHGNDIPAHGWRHPQVLREMLLSPELDAALGAKFKDPCAS